MDIFGKKEGSPSKLKLTPEQKDLLRRVKRHTKQVITPRLRELVTTKDNPDLAMQMQQVGIKMRMDSDYWKEFENVRDQRVRAVLEKPLGDAINDAITYHS